MAAVLVVTLGIVHILAAAALFGGMFYSITVLQPRAKRYFEKPRDFEEFIAFVSNGTRWKMLGGFALIAITGLALIPLHPHPVSRAWMVLMGAKIIVLIFMVMFFSYVSWRLWPARVFATEEEVPKFQRLFRRVGFTMIMLVTIEFVLAIIAHMI